MDAPKLAQAVVHWLEFEWLCNRGNLFNEASLRAPIGHFLNAPCDLDLEPEVSLPDKYQNKLGRRKALDFGLYSKRVPGTHRYMEHAIETKFVTAKRDFKQEIYDDLFRLAYFDPSRDPDKCRRWFVMAGYWKNLDGAKVLQARASTGPGKPGILCFRGVLPKILNQQIATVAVSTQPRAQLKKLWKRSAQEFPSPQWPEAFHVRLAARFPASNHQAALSCLIWEVIRPNPWTLNPV